MVSVVRDMKDMVREIATANPDDKIVEPEEPITDIGDRLKTAVSAAEIRKNRSAEMVPLTKKYEEYRKNLGNLVASIQRYQDAVKELDKSRNEV